MDAANPIGPEDDRRMNAALTDYRQRLDRGETVDREAFLAEHAQVADQLRAYFGIADLVERMTDPHDAETLASPGGTTVSVAPLSRIRYFGDYELLEEIARGGMGVVYKARQVPLNRIVALKMILAGQFASEADVQRFHTEAEAAAQLQHPNIVAIHEIGEHNGQHYFSMDYIEGTSLAARIAKQPFNPREAAALLKQVAEAVHFAHEHGVVHRDLKPANVLLDTRDVPRVTDFGLAKRVQGANDLTGTGQILGTPSYMSPEQAAAQRSEVGPASDVYSLGAIFYELLTGRPPFQADSALDTVLLVIDTEPARPRRLNRRIPWELEQVCLKCLQKIPAKRYRSAQALADDLERFLLGEPTLAGRQIKGRTRRLVFGCGLTLLVVCGGITWGVLKAVPLVIDFLRRETLTQIRENAELLASAGQWQPPLPDASGEQLFPKQVGEYRLIDYASPAGIPDLRIDVPLRQATYEGNARQIDIFLIRATSLECEALFRRIEDLADRRRPDRPSEDEWDDGPDWHGTWSWYGPIEAHGGGVTVKRLGFRRSSPRDHVGFLWCADWLLIARTKKDASPEDFLKLYMQSNKRPAVPGAVNADPNL
jgi:tRNA A-37 threonylcarbamoyl transferase component Bud32